MADASEQAMSMLNALLGGGAGSQSRPWTSYGGINTTGPMTAIQQMRGHITDAATSMLGPMFGPLAGYFASNWLVGQDFTKQGLLHNRFSGLLAPTAGTYANAFQRMQRQQTISMLEGSRKQAQDSLKEAAIRSYYSITNPSLKGQKLEDQVKGAMDNVLSIPSILNYTIDPAQNRRTLQGIKDSQAGFLYWQQRMNPMGLGGDVVSRRNNAALLGVGIKEMAIQANSWLFGGGKGGYKNSFGGFGGGSVAELASILQNASNQMDPAHMTQSINAFKDKVKKTAQALSPLKDIFGQDIKAMTDMLQSVTGQNINQLTPAMIQSIATNTVDMSRYSGATIAQIAGAGQKLFQQTAALGGNSFSRIGGSLTGAYYTGLIAQGNAPAGVHAAQYAGNTQRAVASAQASAGVDRAAMAFGLWQQANPNGTIDDFMAKVRENRAGSGTMMQAIVKTVNQATGKRYTEQSLVRGLATTGYRVSLQSGKLAQLGVSQQYQVKLADSFNYLRMANLGGQVSDRDLVTLQSFMSNSTNSAAVKDLVTNANDKNAVARFAKLAGVSIKAVNFAINRGQILQQASRWSSDIQMAKFSASQKQIRDAMGEVDAQGTGAYVSLWKAISTRGLNKDGSLTLDNGNTISKAAINAHTRAILGEGDIGAKAKALKTALGGDEDLTIKALAMASSDRINDKFFMQNIKDATQGKDEKIRLQAATQLRARMQGHLSSSVSASSFSDKNAKAAYQKVLQEYRTSKDKDAGKIFQGKVRGIQRQQKLSQAPQKLGLTGSQISAFKTIVEKNKAKSEEDLKALYDLTDDKLAQRVGGKENADTFRKVYRATSTNYDRRADFEGRLITVLQKIWSWLNNYGKQEPKK